MSHSVTNSSIEFQPQKFIEQVDELYYSGLFLTIVFSFITASLVSLTLWKFYQHEIILYWFGSYSLFCWIRFISYLYYQNNKPVSVESSSAWFFLLSLSVFVSGLFWGGIGIAANEYFSLNEYQSLVFNFTSALVISMLVAACSIIYKSNPGLMLSFSVPAILPFSVFLLNQSADGLFLIGLLLATFFAVLLMIYTHHDKVLYRVLSNSIIKLFSTSS